MLSSRLARTAAATGGLLVVLGGFATASPTAGADSPPATVAEKGPDDPARGLVWDGLEPGQPGTRCAGAFEIRGRADEVLGCTLTAKSRSKTHNFTSSTGTTSAQVTSTVGRTVTVTIYDAAKRRIATQSSSSGSLSLTGTSTRSGTHRLVVEGQSLAYTVTVTHPA